MWNVVLVWHHCAPGRPRLLQFLPMIRHFIWNYQICMKLKMATRLQWQVGKNWIYFSLFSIKFEIAEISTQRSHKSEVTVESDKAFAAGRALSPADCQPWHMSVGSWAGRVGGRSALKFFVKTQRIPPLVILQNFLRRETRNLVFENCLKFSSNWRSNLLELYITKQHLQFELFAVS